MAYVEVNDARLFFTDEGDGMPLLLVHGTGCDSFDWMHQMPALLPRYRVIAVDRRGHGHSSAPTAGYGPRSEAEDMIALLDSLGVSRFAAMGHSTGGGVVAALAVEHPERVRAIVAVDPSYGINPAARAAFEQLGPALAGSGGQDVYRGMSDESFYAPSAPPHLRPWHMRRVYTVPPHALSAVVIATALGKDQFFFRPESEAYLKRVACPALTVRRLRDGGLTPEWDRAQFGHPYSDSIGWEDAGHFLHQERPDDFNRAVTAWLNDIPARA